MPPLWECMFSLGGECLSLGGECLSLGENVCLWGGECLSLGGGVNASL